MAAAPSRRLTELELPSDRSKAEQGGGVCGGESNVFEHDSEGYWGREGPDEHRDSEGGEQHGAGPGGGDREGDKPRRRSRRREVHPRDPEPHVVLARLRPRLRLFRVEAVGEDARLDRGPQGSHAGPPPHERRSTVVPGRDPLRHTQRNQAPQHVRFQG